jgi:transcriptional regulator with XRE-family HTH domain
MARVSALTREFAHDPDFKAGYERAQSYIRIGTSLRDLREERGWTQSDLARMAGLDQADISRIENGRWGKRGISHEVLERLLPVFGLRISRSVQALPGAEMTPATREAIATMTEMMAAE